MQNEEPFVWDGCVSFTAECSPLGALGATVCVTSETGLRYVISGAGLGNRSVHNDDMGAGIGEASRSRAASATAEGEGVRLSVPGCCHATALSFTWEGHVRPPGSIRSDPSYITAAPYVAVLCRVTKGFMPHRRSVGTCHDGAFPQVCCTAAGTDGWDSP